MEGILLGAVIGAGATAFGAVLTWAAMHSIESRRQSHAELMYWRSARLEAVAQVLASVEDFDRAVGRYAMQHQLVKRGMADWGAPPDTSRFLHDIQRAQLIIPEASVIYVSLMQVKLQALGLVLEQPDPDSGDFKRTREELREAVGLLETAIRREIGLKRSPSSKRRGPLWYRRWRASR